MTMSEKEWPFGLKNSQISNDMLRGSFGKYFLLMLGMNDISTKPNTLMLLVFLKIFQSKDSID